MANKRVVKKKKIAKKKAPMGARTSPAYQEPKLPGEGFNFMSVVMILITLALIGLVVVVFMPSDMSQVKGYPFGPTKAVDPPRNLLREAEDVWVSVVNGNTEQTSITFTEEEVNTYINQRLVVKQAGIFGSFTDVKGIYLDLEKDTATLYIVREIFGIPLTIDSKWEMFLSNDEYIRRCVASGVGRLEFGQAMFRPIMMPFFKFAEEMSREQKVLFDEAVEQIRLEKDAMTIEF